MHQAPQVADSQDYALDIFDTVREPLLILDATLRVRSANRSFYPWSRATASKQFAAGRSQHDDIALVGFGRTG